MWPYLTVLLDGHIRQVYCMLEILIKQGSINSVEISSWATAMDKMQQNNVTHIKMLYKLWLP